jgi:hypothetical protein
MNRIKSDFEILNILCILLNFFSGKDGLCRFCTKSYRARYWRLALK